MGFSNCKKKEMKAAKVQLSVGERLQRIKEEWISLDQQARQPWVEQAETDKKKYALELERFKKTEKKSNKRGRTKDTQKKENISKESPPEILSEDLKVSYSKPETDQKQTKLSDKKQTSGIFQ
eukprot:TRINITY_DN16209_c0_g1_i2.p1 TRINITY_DN16209_c0_g1~~TRINITY_DN16209_c0_g1_i2.p1  ORF type:complete len:123 (+),score=21.92 TRINITY_DN16209_c0_g1_i2:211-579(+)